MALLEGGFWGGHEGGRGVPARGQRSRAACLTDSVAPLPLQACPICGEFTHRGYECPNQKNELYVLPDNVKAKVRPLLHLHCRDEDGSALPPPRTEAAAPLCRASVRGGACAGRVSMPLLLWAATSVSPPLGAGAAGTAPPPEPPRPCAHALMQVEEQYARDVARLRGQDAVASEDDYKSFLRELGGAPPPELMGEGFGGPRRGLGMGPPRGRDLPDDHKVR